LDDVLRSPLELRLRRIAVIVPVLAVVATIVGALPGGLVDSPCCCVGAPPGCIGETLELPTTVAGGWTLAAWTLLTIVIAWAVYRHPTRRRALLWVGSAPVSLAVGLKLWSFEHDVRHTSFGSSALGDAMTACIGAIVVLLLLALPLIAVLSDRSPPRAASARVLA
jgi:hypothetical protein